MQTAVEWLAKQLMCTINAKEEMGESLEVEDIMYYEGLALQMEKEQIVNAFDCDGSPQPGEKWISNGEQYYNETYGVQK